jgi:undecaprenyl-diphosphatase
MYWHVVAGFTIGIVLERAVRRFTGYPDAYFRRLLSQGRKP